MEINLNLSTAMQAEVQKVLDCTDIGTSAEVFRRAFTLLRIHLKARQEGKTIKIIEDDLEMTLPFNVQ